MSHPTLSALLKVGVVAGSALASPAAAAAAAAPSQASRVRGAVLGGLVGDSLALGGHYEYDAKAIADRVGSYTELSAPGEWGGGGVGDTGRARDV